MQWDMRINIISIFGSYGVYKIVCFYLQENFDIIVKILNVMGIDVYRGVTQLNIIELEKWNFYLDYFVFLIYYYFYEVRYFIDYVVYLLVNKFVLFYVLDQICKGLEVVIKISRNGRSVSVRFYFKL